MLPVLAFALAGCAAGGGPAAFAPDVTARDRGETGLASFYARHFEGEPTASGELYDGDRLTAAHRTLPFGTRVRVTNLENDRSVSVVINDRGPFVRGRVIDLSRRAARELDFIGRGLTRVRVEVLPRGHAAENR